MEQIDRLCLSDRWKQLIQLIRNSLDIDSAKIDITPEDWEELYTEAVRHSIEAFLYKGLRKNMHESFMNCDAVKKWRNRAVLASLSSEIMLSVIPQILNDIRIENIDIMVVKGYYIRDMYPFPAARTMGDVDLVIRNKDDIEKVEAILTRYGYEKVQYDENMHVSFTHSRYVGIEVHYALVPDAKRLKAGLINQDIWDKVQTVSKNGCTYFVPSVINHILYCCIHMTNHYFSSGFGLRQVIDFYLLVKNAGLDDTDELVRSAERYGIGPFTEAMLYLCHLLFDLNVSPELAERQKGNIDYYRIFIKEIMLSGTFGANSMQLRNAKKLFNHMGNRQPYKRNYLGLLFPPLNYIKRHYNYAAKAAILVPVAYVHRLIRNLLKRDIGFREKLAKDILIDEHIQLTLFLSVSE